MLDRLGLLHARVAVAFSGGLDSTVLLHLLHAVAARNPLQLSAVHVDHGISPRSADWAQACARRCATLGIPLHAERVQVARDGKHGLEAAARAARYAVFARLQVDAIALAHHLDDQAETVLLQLLRGAGAQGLSAMPQLRLQPGSHVMLVRPLLEIARGALAACARDHGMEWVEDESNASLAPDRNYLRHAVLPHIAARFPGYRETLMRSSRNLADLAAIAEEVARADAGGAARGEALSVAALRGLSPARRLNALRWFLRSQHAAVPPRARLEEALSQLLGAGVDRTPSITLGDVALRRHRGLVQLVAVQPAATGWRIAWHGEAELQLPSGLGVLRFRAVQGAGLSVARLQGAPVSVAPRAGGERFKPAASRLQRSLKDLLREAGVAPWQRERMPLVFCGEQVAWVPGLGWDCRLAAAAGEPGLLPEWDAGGATCAVR